MAAPNVNNVVVGPGTLWWAPIGSPEPAAGVLTPITSPATSVAWPSAWNMFGYTDDGSEFDWTPKFSPIEAAESLVPLKYVTASAESSLAFSLLEMTARNIAAVMNGGTTTTASGITTYQPPLLGAESRIMLGWDRQDGMERMIFRRCIQTGTVKVPRKKAPNKVVIPAVFMLETVVGGSLPMAWYFDSSLLQS